MVLFSEGFRGYVWLRASEVFLLILRERREDSLRLRSSFESYDLSLLVEFAQLEEEVCATWEWL